MIWNIVLIPKDSAGLFKKVKEIDPTYSGGISSNMFFTFKGKKINLFLTNREEFGATLLSYTGPKGSSIGRAVLAKKMGAKLSRHGLFKGPERIAGRTERGIYKAMGRAYRQPEIR